MTQNEKYKASAGSGTPSDIQSVVADREEQHSLERLVTMMRESFGVNLDCYKPSTLQRRISRRMALQKIESLGEYMQFVERGGGELDVLYRDLLVGVTHFFRDVTPFEALKVTVFPRIIADKRPGDAIRIWSPGCATGEEVYTLAIALLELLGPRAADYQLQIFGTDLDAHAIEAARRGVYADIVERHLSQERLDRFFVKVGGRYQVHRKLRDLVVFATQDLTRDAPFSNLDLVSCRNVLMYLHPDAQKRVLRVLHYALAPEGFLMLGTSEAAADSELFAIADRTNKLFARRNVVPETPLVFAAMREATELWGGRPLGNIQQLADRKVLERYGPPGIVVNERLEIVQFRGHVDGYVETMSSPATLDVMALARAELAPEIRHCIHEAMREQRVVQGRVKLRERAGGRVVTIDAMPLVEADPESQCFLVVFHEEVAQAAREGEGGT